MVTKENNQGDVADDTTPLGHGIPGPNGQLHVQDILNEVAVVVPGHIEL